MPACQLCLTVGGTSQRNKCEHQGCAVATASWSLMPSALGVPRAVGALPGDNCPLSHCPPLPGDTVVPSCVTSELWLLLQGSLHCLSAECGIDAWSRPTAPARRVTSQQLLRRRPDAMSFPVAFHYGKTPPGKLLGSEIFRHLMLFLVAQFPELGWNSLEATPVSSSRSRHGTALRTVPFRDRKSVV